MPPRLAILALLVPLAALAACAATPGPDPRLVTLERELRGEVAARHEAEGLAWSCRPGSRAEIIELDAEERRVVACTTLLDTLTGQDAWSGPPEPGPPPV